MQAKVRAVDLEHRPQTHRWRGARLSNTQRDAPSNGSRALCSDAHPALQYLVVQLESVSSVFGACFFVYTARPAELHVNAVARLVVGWNSIAPGKGRLNWNDGDWRSTSLSLRCWAIRRISLARIAPYWATRRCLRSVGAAGEQNPRSFERLQPRLHHRVILGRRAFAAAIRACRADAG